MCISLWPVMDIFYLCPFFFLWALPPPYLSMHIYFSLFSPSVSPRCRRALFIPRRHVSKPAGWNRITMFISDAKREKKKKQFFIYLFLTGTGCCHMFLTAQSGRPRLNPGILWKSKDGRTRHLHKSSPTCRLLTKTPSGTIYLL